MLQARQLQELRLGYTAVSDSGLAHLGSLTQVEREGRGRVSGSLST